MNWEAILLKYAKLAMAQNKVLTFVPKRDKYKVYWKITLTSNVANGEEEIVEED